MILSDGAFLIVLLVLGGIGAVIGCVTVLAAAMLSSEISQREERWHGQHR